MEKGLVIVTGAGQGIGSCVAEIFARERYPLYLIGLTSTTRLNKVRDKCLSLGSPRVEAQLLDVCQPKLVEGLKRTLGEEKISVLVNNAGVLHKGPFENMDHEKIRNQVETNVLGVMYMTSAFLAQVSGAIVNIGSDLSMTAIPGYAVYSATKFAVRSFTEALAAEIPGLRIYCVHPDRTATRMNPGGGQDARKVAYVIYETAMGKYPEVNIKVWEILGSWDAPTGSQSR